MGPITKYVIVGEEGGHRILTGTPEQSAQGVENQMKSQRRRGYLAVMEGDGRNGTTLRLISPMNSPNVPFEQVQVLFAERNKSGGTSNFMFRGMGGSRGGAV